MPLSSTLRPLDVACGLPLLQTSKQELSIAGGRSPRQALERVLLRALRQPPCVFSFSGGRDSSALLALATDLARRNGLADPVPATLVFPGVEESDEERWQLEVLDHLGIREDWVRLGFGSELGAVGPVAQEVLLRHGLLWPFNLHFHLPILKIAAGGTLVTGFGGDELARASASLHAERLLDARRIQRPRDVAVIGLRLSPLPVRWAIERARNGAETSALTWLTPRAKTALRMIDALDTASEPMGWSRLLRDKLWRSRYLTMIVTNFSVMASVYDVRTVHPFVEPTVLQALAAATPFAGPGSRTEIVASLFGDLLPSGTVKRATKGGFTSPLWTEDTVDFARNWSGHGLDERFVDPDRVRAAWLEPDRNVISTTLLQAAWLADHPSL